MVKVERIQNWLSRTNPAFFSGYAILFAFFTYFCMYAFRKPFSAATFESEPAVALPLVGLVNYKIILIITQVIGYMLSKFYGIKFISEITGKYRAIAILAMIGFAELALLGFGLVAAPYNIVFLFLNGLPLGMVWGLVFGFLEGRQVSEVLGAGLSASYIVASGFVKTVGRLLMESGVGEFWMPFATGLLFLPLLAICVFFLNQLPPPTKEDIALRTERRPMFAHERHEFVRMFFPGLFFLTGLYMFLTAYRDFRDNFAVEIYQEAGILDASVLTYPEILVSIAALTTLALVIAIKDNEKALLAVIALMASGSVLIAVGTLAYQAGLIGPVVWMTVIGAGLYIGYVPYGCILFDRLIAAVGFVGTAGFMIYVTDSFGYLGSVFLLLYKNFGQPNLSWLKFFIQFSYTTSIVCLVSFTAAGVYFHYKIISGKRSEPTVSPS